MKMVKFVSALLVAVECGLLASGTLTTPTSAQAAVKTHKVTKLPKTFRGTWYNKGHKFKVTAKKFGPSTYRKKHDTNTAASSERYFMPYTLSKPKHTMYLVTSIGINTIRRTKIGGRAVLIRYDEQEHGNQLTIYTKAKKAKQQKNVFATNPFGINITTRKDALNNQKGYRKMNPTVKKYLRQAMKKKVDQIKFKPFKGIKITSYSAYGFFNKVVH